MNKHHPYYREIQSVTAVTPAEATIAWFYSGKKQPIINVIVNIPVIADGIYDCTQKIQQAIDLGACYFPAGTYRHR